MRKAFLSFNNYRKKLHSVLDRSSLHNGTASLSLMWTFELWWTKKCATLSNVGRKQAPKVTEQINLPTNKSMKQVAKWKALKCDGCARETFHFFVSLYYLCSETDKRTTQNFHTNILALRRQDNNSAIRRRNSSHNCCSLTMAMMLLVVGHRRRQEQQMQIGFWKQVLVRSLPKRLTHLMFAIIKRLIHAHSFVIVQS